MSLYPRLCKSAVHAARWIAWYVQHIRYHASLLHKHQTHSVICSSIHESSSKQSMTLISVESELEYCIALIIRTNLEIQLATSFVKMSKTVDAQCHIQIDNYSRLFHSEYMLPDTALLLLPSTKGIHILRPVRKMASAIPRYKSLPRYDGIRTHAHARYYWTGLHRKEQANKLAYLLVRTSQPVASTIS